MDADPLPGHWPLSLILLTQRSIEFCAPPDWVAWAFIVAIAVVCLIASAFVSGSEIAYFGLTPAEIDDLRDDEQNPESQRAWRLISHSERLLATILIANNLVNITMVVLLTFAINQTVKIGNPVLDFVLQTAVLTFLLLLFGEIFPKLVARGRTVGWARRASATLEGIYTLLGPLARFMVKSGALVNRVVAKKDESISTDELGTALEISDISEGQDKEMLEGILSFGEKEASDIMTSRVDVTQIEYHAGWNEVVETVVESGYSRIPVYDTNQDAIRGVLYSKDLLPYIGKRDNGFRWQSLIREAYFVPESRMIDDLLEDFRKRKIHIAIVIDEYGGTQGIVTLEDIIEEIVGDIDDEYDDEEKLYHRVGPDTYVFEAKIPVVDFFRITGIDTEEFGDAGDAETLAGLLLEIKGDFPKEKESFQKGRCRFMVLDMERHRIMSVRVKVLPIESNEENHGN